MRLKSLNTFPLDIHIHSLLPDTVFTDLLFFICKKNEVILLYPKSVVGLSIKYVFINKAKFSLDDLFVEFRPQM